MVNIDPRLRQALKGKTTQALLILPTPITSSLIVNRTVPRNDAINPDLGFSCDAIDYIAQGTLVQSATLLATNGVVIGLDAGALSSGIRIAPRAKFISEGNPINMNRFVELRSVQEQHGNTVAPIFNGLKQQFSSSTSSEQT